MAVSHEDGQRRISVNLPWNPDFVDMFLRRARLADEIGVDTISVIEGYGHDAFTGLALLARETRNVRLASAIVNVFSRTPATLAQSFGTVDQLSGGRVVIGLGASAPGAIERFHGVTVRAAVCAPARNHRAHSSLLVKAAFRLRRTDDSRRAIARDRGCSGTAHTSDPSRNPASDLGPADCRVGRRLDADLDSGRSDWRGGC